MINDNKQKPKKSRKTVGAQALELLEKPHEATSVIDQQREMQKEYIDNLVKTVTEAQKHIKSNFFVVVITKKEPLMENVLRNYFMWRHSCPTPDYDQAVYHYDPKDENLSLVWVIPDKDTCLHLQENALIVAPEERALKDCVVAFANGTLYRYAKQINGELNLESPVIQ